MRGFLVPQTKTFPPVKAGAPPALPTIGVLYDCHRSRSSLNTLSFPPSAAVSLQQPLRSRL